MGTERPAIPGRGALWWLEDADLHCRPALSRPCGALDCRQGHEPAHLRCLCRNPAGPDPVKRRCRDHGQCGLSQKRKSRKTHPGQGSLGAVPAGLLARPQPLSKWPIQSSRHCSGSTQREALMPYAKPQVRSANSSHQPNAETTSRPQDMNWIKRDVL